MIDIVDFYMKTINALPFHHILIIFSFVAYNYIELIGNSLLTKPSFRTNGLGEDFPNIAQTLMPQRIHVLSHSIVLVEWIPIGSFPIQNIELHISFKRSSQHRAVSSPLSPSCYPPPTSLSLFPTARTIVAHRYAAAVGP